MNDGFLYFIILAAVACGWLLGVWQTRSKSRDKVLARDNYELPYYFSTDIPDYALDAFISSVDVNSDTLETHLTLGAIHRRRGELDRAIRIHENLVRRDGLTENQVSLAKFELALDYVKAGLLDRAEEFLQELIEASESYRKSALFVLVDLYQDEKEWMKACIAVNALSGYLDEEGRRDLAHRQSHFYCEQAENSIAEKDYLGARRSIKRAQDCCATSQRPIILMATLELQLNQPKKARDLIDLVLSDPEEMIQDALWLLFDICQELNDLGYYVAVVEKLYRQSPSSNSLSLLTRELVRLGQHDRLLDILNTVPPADLGRVPVGLFSSLGSRLMSRLGTNWIVSAGKAADSGDHYQCEHCGFETREHYWHCPSCRKWETLKNRYLFNA